MSTSGSPGISMRNPRSSRKNSCQSSARAGDVVATTTAEVDTAAARTDMSLRRDQATSPSSTPDDIVLSPLRNRKHDRSVQDGYLLAFDEDVIGSTDIGTSSGPVPF